MGEAQAGAAAVPKPATRPRNSLPAAALLLQGLLLLLLPAGSFTAFDPAAIWPWWQRFSEEVGSSPLWTPGHVDELKRTNPRLLKHQVYEFLLLVER